MGKGSTSAAAGGCHDSGNDRRATPVGPGRPDPLPTPDPDRHWGLSDLQWLLDGEWTVRSVADRIVASRSHVAVVITRRRGVYCVTTKLHGLEYNHHQSVTLPGALAGVRRDLRREDR
jgi:hypothetical protein